MADEYLSEQTARGTYLGTDLFYIENPLEAQDVNDYKGTLTGLSDWLETDLGPMSPAAHTHVEADITDLQAYLLDITGESLGDLSDTAIAGPLQVKDIISWNGANWIDRSLAETGISEVGHAHLEADITDLQAYLTDITAESINDLDDVAVAGTPAVREILAWNGADWINRTPGEALLSEVGHTHLEADITDLGNYGEIDAVESIVGLWNFIASGVGGFTNYDVTVGDVATPDYGIIRVGDSILGRTNNTTGYNLNGAFIVKNVGGPVTGDIEFAVIDSADLVRFALPKSAVGNATYNPRSMLVAGPAVADSDVVTVSYWQGQGIFHNLVCDTSVSGADLGVQNDLEVEGDIFADSILESTTAAGVTIDGLLIKDSGIPEAAVTAHEAALSILEAQITDLQAYLTAEVNDLSAAVTWTDIPAGNVPDGADATAVHDNVASEISAVTLKATPVSGDFILIEDSAAANVKKRITVGSLPAGSEVNDLSAAVTWANIPDANVPESAVTQHEAALAILWSQITGEPTEFPVAVSKNSAAAVGQRATLNFIEGTNITLTVADDAGGDEVDITINAAGGGASQLSDLSDVNTSTPTDKFCLVADGVDFESRLLTLPDLSDVVSAANTDKFALMANGTTGYVGRALVEDDISDLQAYLTGIGGEVITGLSDVTAKTGSGTVVVFDTSPTIVTPTIASFANAAHDHADAAGGGTLAAAAVPDGADATAIHDNVASEISAITSKVSPIGGDIILIEDSAAANVKKRATLSSLPYPAEVNNLSAAVTWANIPDANVPESAVTQHEAALAILWSQITGEPTEFPVAVSKNSGATVGTRDTLNFIEGTNVTLTIADDGPGGEVDITINSSGGGASQLTDLSDVNTATVTDKFVLVADGVDFESRLLTLPDLSDVVSATNTDKFALMANGTTGYVGRALVEADIGDLGTYLANINSESISELSDVAAMTEAKGDVLVYYSGSWNRLAVGTNTHVLTADSAQTEGVKWAAGGAGGSAKGRCEYVARMYPDVDAVKLVWYTGNASTPGEDAEELSYIDADTTYWMGRFINRGYGDSGLTVEFWVRADGASGNAFWGAAIHRIGDDIEDADSSHTWVWTDLADAVATVVGEYARVVISMTDGANIDSLADNEMFTLIVRRQGDHATDTANGVECFTTRPIIYET